MLHLRRIVYNKQKTGEIRFQEGDDSTNSFSFHKHDNGGKAHAMMASHHEMEIEETEKNVTETEPYLDRMGA